MAECSYARCVQQRRNIRRELQRWTRNMVHIVGLERIAEELMGRRKWKLYQESMSRSYLQPLNNNIKTTVTTTVAAPTTRTNQENYYKKDQFVVSETTTPEQLQQQQQQQQNEEHHTKNNQDIQEENDKFISLTIKNEDEKNGIEIEQKENEKILLQHRIVEERLKDWTPETKCYFCVDGKLDSENTVHGVLSPRHSDSDSSDSHSDNDIPPSLTPSATSLLNNNNNNINNNNHHHYHRSHHHYPHNNNNSNNNNNHHHPHHHHHHPHNLQSPNIHPAVAPINMTTMESVTSMALAAAFAGGGNSPGTAPATATPLSFYTPSLLTHNWYHLANVARTFQTTDRLTPAGDNDKNIITVGGEQPLDLSKGSNNNTITATINNNNNNNTIHNNNSSNNNHNNNANNVRLPSLDTKQIFKAKPRMSAVASRRTYTEDELQAALRDIQSGKLGTRRAAVIYGIPRSTLRNKVYKLALERERESHLNSSSTTPLKIEEEEVMDDDKELSGAEEEKEVEKALQAPLCDILRLSNMEIPVDVIKNAMQKSKDGGQENWAIEHSELGPYIQNLLLASQNLITNQKSLDSNVLNNVVPEFLKRIITDDQLKIQQQNNGENEKLMRPSPSNSVTSNKPDRVRSESDMETDESPSNVILKIPSFRPTSSKNGCDLFNRNQMETNNIASPPIITNESNSPPILSAKMTIKDVKDVIAQSISQKFQQNLEPARRPPPPPPLPPSSLMEMDYKRGTYTPPLGGGISVIKTQGLTRPTYQQQQQQQQHHHHQQHQQQQNKPQSNTSNSGNNNNSSSQAGGKGTRPKRGKYRNYDRDSLVEAVRAVQRGEMSVHRAGSYYGVPHSTLEYKVKERHLMRPRKRDPKPNPVDEKIASLKQNDIRNAQDKLKTTNNSGNNSSGGPMKPPQKFPPTSPNGMKLPIFGEPGMPPLAGYNPAPFPFWPHPGYHIPIDFARNPTTPPFPPPNPEFFASQMMQKLQEDSSRTPPTTTTAATTTTTTTVAATPITTTSSLTVNPNTTSPINASTPALAKSARQIAESLLDGVGSNGSFLDGIIRSSLEQGVPTPEEISSKEDKNVAPEKMSNKALLDQLCRNSRLPPLTKPTLTDPNSSGDESYRKGSTSPLNFSGASREQEASSPPLLHYDRSDSLTNPIGSSSELPTIELSNDSNEEDSSDQKSLRDNDERLRMISPPQQQQQPPRIYLKKDLANPDNLQPEMLMRFRDLLPDTERNGVSDGGLTGSASDNDAPQD